MRGDLLKKFIAQDDDVFIRLAKQPVVGELLKSRGDRRLIESATVLLPSVRSKA